MGLFSSMHSALIEHLLFARHRGGPWAVVCVVVSVCVVGRGECLWKIQRLLSFPVSKSWAALEEGPS